MVTTDVENDHLSFAQFLKSNTSRLRQIISDSIFFAKSLTTDLRSSIVAVMTPEEEEDDHTVLERFKVGQ